MKQDTLEKWILLQESGELDAIRGWLLDRHLRGSAQGRRFRDDLHRITAAARADMMAPDLSRNAMAAILQAARENVSRREEFVLAPAARPFAALRPAMAFAALALLVGASWLVLRKPDATPVIAQAPQPAPQAESALPWDDGLDQAISELGTSLASSSDDWDSSAAGTATGSDLDDMATELMQWEESQI